MKTRNLIQLLILFLLFSCEKKDIESEKSNNIFTLSVKPSYGEFYEKWVFINDINGELLDFKQIELGEEFEFKSTLPVPNDRINVTFFNYYNKGIYFDYNLRTFENLLRDSRWNLQGSSALERQEAGAKIGDLELEVDYYDDLRMEVLGNKDHTNTSITKLSGYPRRFIKWEIFENANDAFYSVLADGKLKYRFWEGLDSSQSFRLNLDDLEDFDKILSLNLPNVNDPRINVKAYQSDGLEYFNIFNNYFQVPPMGESKNYGNLQIGYLNRFPKYDTRISFSAGNYQFFYHKTGSVPEPFNVLDKVSYKIAAKPLPSFAIETDIDHDWKEINFILSDAELKKNILWSFFSPLNEFKPMKLPEEFLSKFPWISLDKFSNTSVRFVKSSQSYESMIENSSQVIESNTEIDLETIQYTVE
ncbi:hypothetical protein [uncultured Arcticibacterium sp.]|uniref:hypothetical protein n=1 Tax=uncultured Arcticibacterium sp. TaxID=2173042 RepID=UPI0030F699BF